MKLIINSLDQGIVITKNSKTKTAGNPNWRKGMNSPNPQGRPKGIIDKRMKVNQSLLADADDIAKVVIQSALSGDMQAASLVLSRIAPTLKAQTETVQFELDATASVTEQAQSVLQAIADGNVAPDVGKQIIEAINALNGIRQIDELEQRINALEKH